MDSYRRLGERERRGGTCQFHVLTSKVSGFAGEDWGYRGKADRRTEKTLGVKLGNGKGRWTLNDTATSLAKGGHESKKESAIGVNKTSRSGL